MPARTMIAVPDRPDSEACLTAYYIAQNAQRSCLDLFALFNQLRVGQQGVTTDQQQDILRSMLVFASAGLDATLKQLVKDTLDQVLEKNEGAHAQFQDFTSRYVRTKGQAELANSSGVNLKNLSLILASKNPRKILVDALKLELTSDSLQSVEAMLKVMSNFALGAHDLSLDVSAFKAVFKIRNEITHEMDVNFQQNRSRRHRRKQEMLDCTNRLLGISFKLIEKIDSVISNQEEVV